MLHSLTTTKCPRPSQALGCSVDACNDWRRGVSGGHRGPLSVAAWPRGAACPRSRLRCVGVCACPASAEAAGAVDVRARLLFLDQPLGAFLLPARWNLPRPHDSVRAASVNCLRLIHSQRPQHHVAASRRVRAPGTPSPCRPPPARSGHSTTAHPRSLGLTCPSLLFMYLAGWPALCTLVASPA